MAFIGYADRADEIRFRVAQETKWIRIQGDMGPVLLAVPGDTFQKLSALFRWIDADAQNLDSLRKVSLGLVDKGRHLGPAPRSPTAAVEEDDGGGYLDEGLRELD